MRLRSSLAVMLVVAAATIMAGRCLSSGLQPDDSTDDRSFVPKAVAVGTRAQAHQQATDPFESTRYRGLDVAANAEAVGEELVLQEQLALELELRDFVPVERMRRSSWLEPLKAQITGWDATILDTERLDSGIHLTLQVYPRHTMAGVAAVGGHSTEHYLYMNGSLHYFGSEGGAVMVTTFN